MRSEGKAAVERQAGNWNWWLRGGLLWSAAMLGSVRVLPCQMGWFLSSAGYSPTSSSFYCFDPVRDSMFYVDDRETFEIGRNGTGGVWPVSPGFSQYIVGMAYDRSRQVLLACSGDPATSLPAVYSWSGTQWQVAGTGLNVGVAALFSHASRGTVMAFGGPTRTSNDLCEWNGSNWTLIPSTNRPPRVHDTVTGSYTRYLSYTYDERRDKIVLFGRAEIDDYGAVYSLREEIWEWDSTNGWSSRVVSGAPGGIARYLIFDGMRGTLIAMFGNGPAVYHAELDGGSSWRLFTPVFGPPSTYWPDGTVANDPVEGLTYATFLDSSNASNHFAGALGTVYPALFAPLGSGCPGSLGTPNLHLTKTWTRAWLGRTLSIDVSNLPQSVGMLLIGRSHTTSNGHSLPFLLTSYGMPGCRLLASTDVSAPLIGSNHTANWTLPVPNLPALIGMELSLQGFALDPGANAAGVTASNGVRVTAQPL